MAYRPAYVWNGTDWDTVGDDRVIPKTLLTDKGSIIAASATDTPVEVVVGTDGYILTADSSEVSGVAWAPPASPAGGVGLDSVFLLMGA
jgi:hypothetical protein